jgi:flagellar hook-length control protein FliK
VGINPAPPPNVPALAAGTGAGGATGKPAAPAAGNAVWPPQKLPASLADTSAPLAKTAAPPGRAVTTPVGAGAAPGVPASAAAPSAAAISPAPTARIRKPAAAARAAGRAATAPQPAAGSETSPAGSPPPEAAPTGGGDSDRSAIADATEGQPLSADSAATLQFHTGPATTLAASGAITPSPPASVPAAGAVADATVPAGVSTPAVSPTVPGPAAAATIALAPPVAAVPLQDAVNRTDVPISPNAVSASGAGQPSADPSVANTTPQVTAKPDLVQTHTEVGSSAWTEELGTHLVWMAHQGITSASLRLQPEELGPLEVKISVHEAAVSVWFGARDPGTRTALEQALPQLKDLFSAQGFNLTDAGVSHDTPGGSSYPSRAAPAAAGTAQSQNTAAPSGAARHRGLIDTYA